MTHGLFVAVEGIDGSGSTTLVAELARRLAAGRRRVHPTCEPSRGPIGALIRQILSHRLVVPTDLGPASPGWANMALLFAADRLDHLEAEVLPRLREGTIVICDRYDLSSLAYQTATAPADGDLEGERGRGGLEARGGRLAWIREINRQARRPDLTLVLDVAPEVAARRREQRGAARELYEDDALQVRLAEAYAAAEQLVPGDPLLHLDGGAPLEEVVAEAMEGLLAALGA